MKLEGSAAYLRQQMADRIAKETHLLMDSEWMKLYALCIIAAELEAIRGHLHHLTSEPSR